MRDLLRLAADVRQGVDDAACLTVGFRDLGLVVWTGNPRKLAGIADLGRRGLRFVNRQPGSGTRLFVDTALAAAGHTYEQDGALWLKSTEYGDDKDRVMRKGDGTYTYFVPDVAYHLDKYRRGFAHVVNVQGSDHHSTVDRVRASLNPELTLEGVLLTMLDERTNLG